MKKYLSIIFCFVLLSGCNKEKLGLEDFYENLSARFLNIYVDKDFYITGGEPIVLSHEVLSTFFDTLRTVPVRYIANADTLPDNTFAPKQPGRYALKAILPNGTISNIIRVEAFAEEDVERLELTYLGPNYLTTRPWSISNGFKQTVIVKGNEFDLTNDEGNPVLINGVPAEAKSGLHFDQAGEYTATFKLGNLTSNEEILYVREAKDYEIVEFPVVFHFVNADRHKSKIPGLISEVNRLFNNNSITINDVVNAKENPNKANMFVRFYLATSAPSGERLDAPGIHTIVRGEDISTYETVNQLAQENYWNPNKYINIYVASGDEGRWRIPDDNLDPTDDPYVLGDATRAPVLNEEIAGVKTLNSEPVNPFFIRIFLNGIFEIEPWVITHEIGHLFSLIHNWDLKCTFEGDYVPDTYAYNRDIVPFINCEGEELVQTNIMDYDRSTHKVFTYGQRSRVRLVMEHVLFLPTPKNLLKDKKNLIDPRNLIFVKPVQDPGWIN